MWHDLKIFQKGLVLVGILIVLETGFTLTLAKLLHDAASTAAKESYYSNISGRTSQIFELAFEIHGNLLCCVWGAGPQYPIRVRQALEQTEQEYDTLEPLLKDHPEYLARLKHCRELTRETTPMVWEVLQLAEQRRLTEAYERFTSVDFVKKKQPVLAALYSFIEEQQPALNENVLANMQAKASVKSWIVAGMILNVILAIGLFLLLVRGITARLGVVVDNAKRLASSQTLRSPIKGKDEVGELDSVFHHMAAVLADARKKEQSLIDNACDVICSVDSAGRFLKVSPACEIVWGTQPEVFISNSLQSLVIADDLHATLDAIKQMKEGNEDLSIENRITHHATGEVRDMHWSAHWSERDNCVFCVVHDVTEHKRGEELLKTSEERIRTILDNTQVGLLSTDQEGTIDQVNPRAVEMLQYQGDELRGRKLITLLEDQEAFNGSELIDRLCRGMVELNVVRKSGQLLPMELSASLFDAPEGKQFLINSVDITERRQLERMKQEFVAAISDNLRIPLDSVRQFLDRLTNDSQYHLGLKERGLQGAQLALRNVGRLLRLTNDLVDVATFESGTMDLECTNCDLGGILERSAEAVRVFAEKHSVSIDLHGTQCTIFADQDRLERVVVNLLSNAIKFSPSGSTVTVLVEDTGDSVVTKVIDHGRGIPASHIDLVFERFKQVTESDASQKGGTGLGLAICKAIIEQHGGAISVDSEYTKGSTFRFSLPKRALQAPSPADSMCDYG